MLDENSKGKKCTGMEGLVKEGSEIMDENLGGCEKHTATIETI